jgi:hypothetical protein
MLKHKNYIIATLVSIFIIVLFHVAYDIVSLMNTLGDMEFYIAFIGGGLTLFIYNAICKRNKTV